MIKTIDTEYFDDKILRAMCKAVEITGSTSLWCPIALKSALELMPEVEPANDRVPMPQNADQAHAMALLAESWLKHNAPERLKEPAQAVPVAWKHDCAALLTNDVELWVDHCPHCGKPRAAHPAPLDSKQAVPVAWLDEEFMQAYTIAELADADGTGFKPLYTNPAPIDSDTRKMSSDLCDMIIANKTQLIDISRVIELRERLEAGA